jgi:hypothetical protein
MKEKAFCLSGKMGDTEIEESNEGEAKESSLDMFESDMDSEIGGYSSDDEGESSDAADGAEGDE